MHDEDEDADNNNKQQQLKWISMIWMKQHSIIVKFVCRRMYKHHTWKNMNSKLGYIGIAQWSRISMRWRWHKWDNSMLLLLVSLTLAHTLSII